jgi:hypothetical protein
MPDISCYLADLDIPTYPEVDDTLPLGGTPLVDYFSAASMLPSKSPAITLNLDVSLRHKLTSKTPLGVGDDDLQKALSQIIAAAPAHSPPNVVLILARSYIPNRDVFGFMFDLDWATPTYGPRQGCAVFLEKISSTITEAAKKDPDFRNLVAYVAAHELAHAFNLWHVQAPDSFLLPWPPDNFIDACSFVQDEMTYLTYAVDPDLAKYVLPGGSNFNDHGTIPNSSSDNGSYLLPEPPKLTLKIELKQKAFYNFENAELDVRLALANPGSEPAEIPDQLHPGYKTCEIWITKPNGERFKFHPAFHFCCNQTTKKITRNNPLERDISIFRHKGDYAFPTAGIYKIQVTFQASARTTLTSNVVSFEILTAKPQSREYRAMREVLTSPETIRLLRYKSRVPSNAIYGRLKRFTAQFPSTAGAGTVHYSLGRAFLHSAQTATDPKTIKQLQALGKRHLKEAAGQRSLSNFRKKKIKWIIKTADLRLGNAKRTKA